MTAQKLFLPYLCVKLAPPATITCNGRDAGLALGAWDSQDLSHRCKAGLVNIHSEFAVGAAENAYCAQVSGGRLMHPMWLIVVAFLAGGCIGLAVIGLLGWFRDRDRSDDDQQR